MTIDEATTLAFSTYANFIIGKIGDKPKNLSEVDDWSKLPKTDQLAHALWMCQELMRPATAHYSIDKRSRWLGFIQGVLIINGYKSINTERNITRPWFNSK